MTPGIIVPEMNPPAVNTALKTLSALVVYPERDGNPLSDNTKQARWIFTLFGNLCALFMSREDVFVAADLLWYPEEGNIKVRMAPDVMVVFGVPKGDRGSYVQCREGPPPAVVFEILSPSNKTIEMIEKHSFYDERGVKEYYIYDPDANTLVIYTRGKETLRRIQDISTFVSPLLGIRFEMTEPEMTVYGPGNKRFLTFEELSGRYDQEKLRADEEALRANEEKLRADEETLRANEEKLRADEEALRADEAKRRANEEKLRADAAVARSKRITELSRKLRRGEASAEELSELQRYENEVL